MNDDIIIEPKNGPADADLENDTPTESVDSNPDTADRPNMSTQVFDISPDLNISPVDTDDTDQVTPTTQPVAPAVSPMPTIPEITPPVIPDRQPAPASTPTPIPISTPAPSAIRPALNSIRTYESDIANLITRKGTSTADIVMAEKKKETGESDLITNSEPSNAGKKIYMALISLVIVGIGIVGAYYLYSISPLAPAATVVQQAKVSSLIPSDKQETMSVDGLGVNAVISQVRKQLAKPGIAGTIEEIIPYVTKDGVKNRLTASDMIGLMDITAPDTLTRSLTPSWMLGVYTDKQNQRNIFVVVTNNFFQNAFAGMLSWESVMPDDLKQYLYPAEISGIANAPTGVAETVSRYMNPLLDIDSVLPSAGTTTGTTTITTGQEDRGSQTLISSSTASTTATSTAMESSTPITPYPTLRGQFVDKIIKNKDVREFVTVNGDTLFLYSFITNDRLVIADDEATLVEIVTRLEKESFIR